MLKRRFLPFLLIFVSFLSKCTLASDTAKLVLLHTNDMHGHMFPYENLKVAPAPEKVGGFQYLSTLIKEERYRNPGCVVLVDGGDISQGSLYSNLAYGIPMIEMMNFLRYDVSIIGNHEFDWGEDRLKSIISNARFPVLSSNIIKKETGNGIDGSKPYIIKNVNGIRLGIIGISCTDTTVLGPDCKVNNYYFLSAKETLEKYIPILRFINKVDLIVVVSHLGYNEDILLAKEISDIDIIVGAHSHKPLEQPVSIGKTLIVQGGSYMGYLGKLTLEFDLTSKKITGYEGKLIKIVDSNIDPDPEVSWIMDNYKKKYAKIAQEVIGTCTVALTRSNVSESNIGNLAADILKHFGKADIGLINSAGLREDLPAGDINMELIYGFYPFDNILVTMELTGKDVINILEKSFDGKHSILQVSGIKIKYDLSKPKGQQLVSITVGNGNKPIDPNAMYKVATADFLSLGGDGYDGFKEGKNINSIMLIRDAIVKYFIMASPITSKIEGRIEVIK